MNTFSIKETPGLRGGKSGAGGQEQDQCSGFQSTFICIINPSLSGAQKNSKAGSLLSPTAPGMVQGGKEKHRPSC